jgi:hypothetical protein
MSNKSSSAFFYKGSLLVGLSGCSKDSLESPLALVGLKKTQKRSVYLLGLMIPELLSGL